MKYNRVTFPLENSHEKSYKCMKDLQNCWDIPVIYEQKMCISQIWNRKLDLMDLLEVPVSMEFFSTQFSIVSYLQSMDLTLVLLPRSYRLQEWSKGGRPPVNLGFNFNSLGTWNEGMMSWIVVPRCSIYGLFTYIWVVLGVNVGKYTIHWAYGANTWRITMVIVGKSPKGRVVPDPFQMAELYGL